MSADLKKKILNISHIYNITVKISCGCNSLRDKNKITLKQLKLMQDHFSLG